MIPKPEPGRDGKDGKDGKDGVDGKDGSSGDARGFVGGSSNDGSFDLAFYFQGVTTTSEVLDYEFTRHSKFPQNLWGSTASARTASTAETIFAVKKNNSSIGSITFPASGARAVFSFPASVTFQRTDVITIEAPASADATLADIRITLQGVKI